MKTFMDQDFLLDTPAAAELYHTYAEGCPIIDYHNHLATKDIANARSFSNLTQIWLEGDHYKWRAMRACGVDESYITGDKPDEEKFMAWAEVVPRLAGCPLYHWTHLELQRYFGITEILTPESAPHIWEQTCEMLAQPGCDTVSLLEKQNVKMLCTTDDPADSLEWHNLIAGERDYPFKVLPSFRPDRFLNAEAEAFPAAVASLAGSEGMDIESLEDLKGALSHSLDRFGDAGCKVSDHGFTRFVYGRNTGADAVFEKAMAGETLTETEIADYRGELLRFLGSEYAKRGIVMQMHLGAVRNANPRLYAAIGADAGGDSVGPTTDPYALTALLADLCGAGMPRMILYNLNPAENAVLSTLAVDFAPMVQFGAAWWFNDTMRGMNAQLDELMETGLLAKSVGMLTDSRSFTSFPRHEYYRRILCAKLGQLVGSGQYPGDLEALGQIVTDVCWRNAVEFFGF